jgi:fructoselysine-6-P-deglycase FrlB-like protein
LDSYLPAVRAFCSLPLVTVGSGGSFTTAHFAATLHRDATGKLSTPFTPLEVLGASIDLRANAVLLATAGGRNPDVLGAFRRIAVREPRRLVVFCTSPRTPLALLASNFDYVDFVEIDLPFRKDGFLATNSLLALTVLLTRVYAKAMNL